MSENVAGADRNLERAVNAATDALMEAYHALFIASGTMPSKEQVDRLFQAVQERAFLHLFATGKIHE